MKPSEKTLYYYFEKYAKERGNDKFIFDENKSYTVAQTFNIVKSLAKQFIDLKGKFVGVKATRTVNTMLIFYALQLIGGIAVMYDPREEITENIYISEGKLYKDGKQTELILTEEYDGEIKLTNDGKAVSAVIYTSGSTGGSKAVKLSQYNFINNSLDTEDIGGYRPDDINILIVPVHHVFGLALIMTAVVTGHSIFVPERVETDYILDCMEKYRVTRLNGVPSMYLALAEKKGSRKLYLNCGLIGGGPCTEGQFISIEKRLGITLIPVYGMSECIGISCGSFKDGIEDRCNSVGKVYSMNTVKIEEDGEISVQSPAMSGEAVEKDGFLHTGDLGYIDEKGFLHINGRKKDIIIRNGNNLSALDIERKILSLQQVKDVCVVGIPDEKQGEVPCAMIVCLGSVSGLLSSVLTKIELPAKINYVQCIPLTSTGKPDKQKVKRFFEK